MPSSHRDAPFRVSSEYRLIRRCSPLWVRVLDFAPLGPQRRRVGVPRRSFQLRAGRGKAGAAIAERSLRNLEGGVRLPVPEARFRSVRPDVSSADPRQGRLMLERLIAHIKEREGVRFQTMAEVASELRASRPLAWCRPPLGRAGGATPNALSLRRGRVHVTESRARMGVRRVRCGSRWARGAWPRWRPWPL